MSAVVPPPPTTPKNGIGTAGFVLGLLALLFSFIPFVGVIAWPLAIFGLIFGVIGISRARNGQANNQGLAIAGTVLAGLGMVICIAWVGLVGSVANDAAKRSESISTEAQQSPVPGGDSANSSDAPIELAFGQTHTWGGGETVQVSEPRQYEKSNPYELPSGARAVEVDLTITNGTDDEINPISWDITATHDGRATQPVLFDDHFANAQIPPGGTVTFTRAFQINPDSGELRISVKPNFLATDTAYFHGRF